MNLLLIGGTRFVGRHLVDAALARGDRVTLFNRGQTGAAPPPGVAWLRGDRQGDLSVLRDASPDASPGASPDGAPRRWDAVIDCCAYLPADAERMAAALADRVGRYVLISSVSAYASAGQPNAEDAPLGRIADPGTTVVDGRSYGPLKALCEAAVTRQLGPDRTLLIRPGLVVGPFDPTQRFTWWPARLARAAVDRQPVLVPGAPDRQLQCIDARDLADFVLHAIVSGAQGAFNVVAPPGFTTMAGLVQACAEAAGCQPADLRWIGDAQLLAQGITPWVDLPLWLPADGEMAAFMAVPTARAEAAGLTVRPLAQTVADTLAWWRALPAEAQAFVLAGLAPEREAAVLAAGAALGTAG